MNERGLRFARYADDFVIVCQTTRHSRNVRATARLAKCAQQNKKSTASITNEQAQKALTLVTDVLENELGLTLSPEKWQTEMSAPPSLGL